VMLHTSEHDAMQKRDREERQELLPSNVNAG